MTILTPALVHIPVSLFDFYLVCGCHVPSVSSWRTSDLKGWGRYPCHELHHWPLSKIGKQTLCVHACTHTHKININIYKVNTKQEKVHVGYCTVTWMVTAKGSEIICYGRGLNWVSVKYGLQEKHSEMPECLEKTGEVRYGHFRVEYLVCCLVTVNNIRSHCSTITSHFSNMV